MGSVYLYWWVCPLLLVGAAWFWFVVSIEVRKLYGEGPWTGMREDAYALVCLVSAVVTAFMGYGMQAGFIR